MTKPKGGPAHLNAPCSNCPFLKKGGVRVRVARMKQILQASEFSCHKTVDYSERDDETDDFESGPKDGEAACGGFLIFKEKQGESTQMMRIAERLGMYAPADQKQHDKVFNSRGALLASCTDADDQEDLEFCTIANERCEAPCGYMGGGGIIEGENGAKYRCEYCDEPVCGECSKPFIYRVGRKKVRICDDCIERGKGERVFERDYEAVP